MTADLTGDLNATITAAVNARIEAAVAEAFASDEFMGRYVTAALQQTVEVPKRDGYGRDRVPFLHSVLTESIREATKRAVAQWLAENAGEIEAEVAKALRRETKSIAAALTKTLTDVADKTYGVSVEVNLKMPRSDG